jgi:hypothetical protein
VCGTLGERNGHLLVTQGKEGYMNESKQEFVDLCWKELLNQCASDPDKAIRLVMVTKDDVNKAMTKVFNIIQQNK